LLFPDEQEKLERGRPQLRLPGMEPADPRPRAFGNAIKKAYLSKGSTRSLTPGDCLLFYRSHDLHAATTVGVVEDTLVSSDPSDIAAFVGPRTVYSFDEIVAMAHDRPVLAILFRHDRSVEPIPGREIMSHGALRAAPQSISRVREEGLVWMRNQLTA
jgi:hypothetical protein